MQRDGGPGGAGGAGNPTGGSFTGPAETLEIIGDHAYAYSGDVTVAAASSATTTMLDFQTGNFYLVGTFSFTGQNTGSNDEYLSIALNNNAVFRGRYPSGTTRISEQPVDLILPPYTQVTVKLGVQTTPASMTFALTGRIYRG